VAKVQGTIQRQVGFSADEKDPQRPTPAEFADPVFAARRRKDFRRRESVVSLGAGGRHPHFRPPSAVFGSQPDHRPVGPQPPAAVASWPRQTR
jgi:hypothetical protein